jgi:hypothetical protein
LTQHPSDSPKSHRRPTPGRGFRNRLVGAVAIGALAASVAASAAGPPGTDDIAADEPSAEELLAASIVTEALAAEYDWQNVAVMDSILPDEAEEEDEAEPTVGEPGEAEAKKIEEEPAEAPSSSGSSSAPIDIAADCSGYSGNRAIGCTMTLDYGWGMDQFGCLEKLWTRESGWNERAYNSGSGAYGIPQSLPGNKMASHGDDWETNPTTQIAWGLDYIKGRYGNACGAWNHSEANGWY